MYSDKSILCIGGDGYIGKNLNIGISINKKKLNIIDRNKIEKYIKIYKPKIIINFASILKINKKNEKLANKTNTLGVINLVELCKINKIKLIHFSSAAVFSGNFNAKFHETSRRMPINVYGKTKKKAEDIIKSKLNNYLIIRPGWVFGSTIKSKQRVFEKLVSKIRKNEDILLSNDQTISPTYLTDLKKILKKLINKDAIGIYNVSNVGYCTAFLFFQYIINKIESESNFKLIKFQEYNIDRSSSERIYSKKLKLNSWKRAVDHYFLNNPL